MNTDKKPRPEPVLSTPIEEYALLVDAVRDYALFVLAPDGTIRTWNPGARRIMGYTTEEALGRHFSIFYENADNESEKPRRELEIAASEGRLEDEGWRVRKDGTRFWANTILTALHEKDGSLHGFAKVTRDLTERKLSEERLRRSEEMFRLLVSSVKDYAIFMLDPDGHIMSWNEGAHAIKGYEPEEVFGEHFSLFYTPEDADAGRPARLLNMAARDGRVEDEGWRVRKDGTRFWAHVVITAVHDSTGSLRGFAKITRDLTARKRAEEIETSLREQRQARERADQERRIAEASAQAAEDANRAKDEFLMMLSHELRTPLTSILGWSRLLPALEPGDESFEEGLDTIARSAELQATLIDDILDISRIVAGKLRLELSAVDVRQSLEEAVEQVRDNAEERDVRIEMNISDGLGTAQLDRVRMNQIVWNLLTNAVKFSPAGGKVTVAANRTDKELEIVVQDEGEGIAPDFLPYIFDPFRQAEMGVNRPHGGLGLGLTIVRHLVTAHDGSIVAESEGLGKGATFRISIPIVASSPSAESHPSGKQDRRLDGRLDGCHILVVDDDASSRRFISSLLQKAGASTDVVDSVASGLNFIDENKPDLIITDIAMPDLGGEELLRRLREQEHTRETLIVAISAFDSPGSQPSDEFDAFLRKPVDPFDLVACLEDLLEKKRAG